ncbi:MAG: hypothetical protein HRT57_11970, partial [Crocinitomicaceae bacterium]|nr:hypothetical protein [Crocinitomicaceae bacterium]
VAGTPLFIYGATALVTGFAEEYDSFNPDVYQSTTGLVTALIASVLGVHSLVSTWIDKRKFRSVFNAARVDLMNIHFALQDEHAVPDQTSESVQTVGVVTEELRDDLKAAIQESRKIVNIESQKYFELDAAPSFDVSSILTSSASTAKSLFNSFKSKRFANNMERLEAEEAEKYAEKKEIKKEIKKNELTMQLVVMKIGKTISKETKLLARIDDLEKIPEKAVELKLAEKDLVKLEDDLDKLELQYDELVIQIEATKEELA